MRKPVHWPIGIDAVVFTHGSNGGGKVWAETVDYGGVRNILVPERFSTWITQEVMRKTLFQKVLRNSESLLVYTAHARPARDAHD